MQQPDPVSAVAVVFACVAPVVVAATTTATTTTITATSTVVQDRRQLLDRFAQHTQHCKACRTAYGHASTALRVTGILALISASAALVMAGLAASGSVLVAQAAATAAAGAAAPALVGAASAQVAASSSWGLAGVMVVVAGLLGGAYVALRQLVQKFVFVDYDKHHCGKQPS